MNVHVSMFWLAYIKIVNTQAFDVRRDDFNPTSSGETQPLFMLVSAPEVLVRSQTPALSISSFRRPLLSLNIPAPIYCSAEKIRIHAADASSEHGNVRHWDPKFH